MQYNGAFRSRKGRTVIDGVKINEASDIVAARLVDKEMKAEDRLHRKVHPQMKAHNVHKSMVIEKIYKEGAPVVYLLERLNKWLPISFPNVDDRDEYGKRYPSVWLSPEDRLKAVEIDKEI